MKQAFILIEVLISLAITGIIGLALFSSFDQVNRSLRTIDNMIDIYAKAAMIGQQFERDFTGAMLPVAAFSSEEQKTDQNKDKKKNNITRPFFSISKDNLFKMLSLITTSPLQIYWADKAGKAKPRIARVVYRLVEGTHKNEYRLLRQEGYNLAFEVYDTKEALKKAMEVADGIKQMDVEFFMYTSKEKRKSTNKPYETSKEWKGESEEKGGEKKNISRLPDGIIITLVLWDTQRKRDTTFMYTIPLIAQGVITTKREAPPQVPPTPTQGQTLFQQMKEQEQARVVLRTDGSPLLQRLFGQGKPVLAQASTRPVVPNSALLTVSLNPHDTSYTILAEASHGR